MNFDSFKNKLGEWASYFKPFIESEKMDEIYRVIKEDSRTERIFPLSDNTFRAFSTTRKEDIKVIFYLMDPYPRSYKDKSPQATGIAMDCSCSPDGVLQPSLKNFYDEVSAYLGWKAEYSPSLEYLHEQGVMMLNTDLTVKQNKTGSHEGLWEPFQKYFLEEVMRDKPNMIYVLCGKVSHKLKKYIYPLANHIFMIEHPAAASHTGGNWKSDGIFSKINNILKEQGKLPVFWNKRDWDEFKTPPF